MHFVYIVIYLGKMLVIDWKISSLIIVWLCTLKKMQMITLIMKLSYNDFKI